MVARVNPFLNEALRNDVGRSQVSNLNRLQTMPKIGSLLRKAASEGTGGDSLSLSEPLKMLKEMGVDLEKSSFGQVNQSFTFSLQFSDAQITGLTTNGSYDLHSQSLQVDLSFSSMMSVVDAETGEERKELFQFEFHLEASQVQIAMGDEKAGKEDILQFAEKILKKLSGMYSEGKEVNGLELDNDELKELASGEEVKLLKGIRQIIHLLQKIDHTRGKSGEHGRLKSGRGEALEPEGMQLEEQSLEMSLTVRRVSEVLTNVSTVIPQTEDTSTQSGLEQ
ncbi:MAG: hypothetical protein AB9866_30965 [Syntrophobacteraceae bacterium]